MKTLISKIMIISIISISGCKSELIKQESKAAKPNSIEDIDINTSQTIAIRTPVTIKSETILTFIESNYTIQFFADEYRYLSTFEILKIRNNNDRIIINPIDIFRKIDYKRKSSGDIGLRVEFIEHMTKIKRGWNVEQVLAHCDKLKTIGKPKIKDNTWFFYEPGKPAFCCCVKIIFKNNHVENIDIEYVLFEYPKHRYTDDYPIQ